MRSAALDRKHEMKVGFNCSVFVKEGKTVGEQIVALMLHIKLIETGS